MLTTGQSTPKMINKMTVTAMEMSSEPRQPTRLEKKKNTAASYPAPADPRRPLLRAYDVLDHTRVPRRAVGDHDRH